MTSSGPHQHLQPDDPLARRVNIAVLTTAALLVVLSTVVALHEYRVFSQALNGDFGRYIGADGAAVRLTSLSRSPGVAPCLRDLQRIEVFGACGDPEEQSRACLTALDAHLQTYPLHGEGWLQRGLLFERLGGTPDQIAIHLLRSSETAPFEAAVVRRRTSAALRTEQVGIADPGLAARLAALIDRDVETLALHFRDYPQARDTYPLAVLYLNSEEPVRARIERVVEQLEASVQSIFVREVRRAASL